MVGWTVEGEVVQYRIPGISACRACGAEACEWPAVGGEARDLPAVDGHLDLREARWAMLARRCQMIAGVDISGAPSEMARLGATGSHWAEEAWRRPSWPRGSSAGPRLMRRRSNYISTAAPPCRHQQSILLYGHGSPRRSAASATVPVCTASNAALARGIQCCT